MSSLFNASMDNLRAYIPKPFGGGERGSRGDERGGAGEGKSEAGRRRAEAVQWGGARMASDAQRRQAGAASSGFFAQRSGTANPRAHFSPEAEAERHNAPFNDHHTQRVARGGIALEC